VSRSFRISVASFLLSLIIIFAPACPAPNDPSPYGVNGTLRGLAEGYVLARQSGFKWVRVFLPWSRLQTSPGGAIDWTGPVLLGPGCGIPAQSADQVINEAFNANMSILVVLQSTPCWAKVGGGSGGAGCENAVPVASHFQAFAAAAVARYDAKVRAWELWNEPNFDAEFLGSAAQYRTNVLAPGFDGIRSASNSAFIMAPTIMRGDFFSPEKSEALGDWLLDSEGNLVRDINAITFHAYSESTATIETVASNSGNFAQLHGNKVTWMTEVGWATGTVGSECPHGDGSKIVSALDLVHNPSVPNLAKVFVFSLHDRTKAACDRECKYGLLTDTGEPKPRYDVVKSWVCSQPDGACDP